MKISRMAAAIAVAATVVIAAVPAIAATPDNQYQDIITAAPAAVDLTATQPAATS